MTVYLETSVIVPFFTVAPTSALITDFIGRRSDNVIGMLGVGEFASALSRLQRTTRITPSAALTALADFDAWLDTVDVIATGADEVRTAIALVRRFDLGLRMPDAIHAATCLRRDLTLATFDTRLARAAAALGIDVVVPA